ncbi:MAG TPA: tetratricopeptide repeat protein [Desulfomonilaceae bacterium]|nr:tetratricopeptide repeat protein [Desulfomonilaceae bacterium]
MKCYHDSSLTGTLDNERGSSAFSFAGYAIIAIVIIGAVLYFPWGDIGKQGQDQNFVSATKAMANKQWAEAVTLFGKSIQGNPDNISAYLGRSKANLMMGNMDKALEDANTAIQKKPTAQGYGQRAVIEKVQKKTEEAMKDFNEAVKLDPNFAWAYAQRADMHSRLKDQEKALKDINKALSVKPDFVDALRLRAWVHNRMGKCREASEDFARVEKLSPNDAWTMQDKAWFLLTCPDEKLQDSTEAMKLAKKALEMTNGKDGVVQETIAEAFFRQGDPLKAVEHQRKAIELGSQKCPDGSCLKEMQERLQKYEMAARNEVRTGYEIISLDSGS